MSAPWLYDSQRHPEGAAFMVRHRSCAEAFAHGIAWFTSLVLFVFSGVVIFLDLDASPYPLAQCVLSGVLFVLVVGPGDWALANSKAFLSYAYMASLYGLWVALIWTSVMCRATTPAGLEYIEENWYLLQAQVVIPFTTQLDQKANYQARPRASRARLCWRCCGARAALESHAGMPPAILPPTPARSSSCPCASGWAW